MKKTLLLILAVVLSQNAFSKSKTESDNYGFYFGVNGGTAEDKGEGIEKTKGSALGAQLGYRWVHWALELGYTKFDLKAGTGQAPDYYIENAELSVASVDLIVRTFIFRYITLGFGFGAVSGTQNIKLTNIYGNSGSSVELDGDASYGSAVFEAGIVLPLFRNLDLWLMYHKRNWTSTDYSISDSGSMQSQDLTFTIQHFSGNIVYYFD